MRLTSKTLILEPITSGSYTLNEFPNSNDPNEILVVKPANKQRTAIDAEYNNDRSKQLRVPGVREEVRLVLRPRTALRSARCDARRHVRMLRDHVRRPSCARLAQLHCASVQ